jgi:arginyl-tRNA--protein-N-Asp/Glu arginylyltransferase
LKTTDDLLLIPLRDALARSARRAIIEILAPPYDAAGIGTLRVVRAVEEHDRLELTATYEGYARL